MGPNCLQRITADDGPKRVRFLYFLTENAKIVSTVKPV